jgi:hypothetical protein
MEETTMVTIMRTLGIAPGKTGEAIAFANQIVKDIKEKYGATAELLMPIGGNPARIAFRINYENMAQWEALTAKFMADADLQGTIAKNSGNFLPGSANDEIWRTI